MPRFYMQITCVLLIHILFLDLTQTEDVSFETMKTIYIKAEEGTRVDIPCGCPFHDPRGHQPHDLTWVKGESKTIIISRAKHGKRLHIGRDWEDSKIGLNGSSLTIPRLQFPRDHGEMVCLESAEENVILTVLAAAKSVEIAGVKSVNGRQTLDVPDGKSARVTCSAQGNPDPWVRWNIETGLIPTAIHNNSWSIRFPVSEDMDGKMIKCTAKNDLGAGKTAEAYLRILRAPKNIDITGTPKSLSPVEGQQLDLVCRGDGVPRPSYRWQFQGEDGSQSVIVARSSRFTIRSIKSSQAGKYKCIARNSQGHHSSFVSIKIPYPPKLIVTYDEKTKTLSCSVKESHLSVTFDRWQQVMGDNVLATHQGNNRGQNSVLHLSSLTYEDTGFYVCRASSEETGTGSARVYVKPQTKPVFADDQPEVFAARQNQPLVVSVFYYAHPAPSIVRWDKRRVQGGHGRGNRRRFRQRQESANITLTFHGSPVHINGTAAILSIQKLLKKDGGEYTLTLGNSRGLSVYRVNINVLHPSHGYSSEQRDVGGYVMWVLIGLGVVVLLIVAVVLLCACGVIPWPGRKSTSRQTYAVSTEKEKGGVWAEVEKTTNNETFHEVDVNDVMLKEDVNENLQL